MPGRLSCEKAIRIWEQAVLHDRYVTTYNIPILDFHCKDLICIVLITLWRSSSLDYLRITRRLSGCVQNIENTIFVNYCESLRSIASSNLGTRLGSKHRKCGYLLLQSKHGGENSLGARGYSALMLGD